MTYHRTDLSITLTCSATRWHWSIDCNMETLTHGSALDFMDATANALAAFDIILKSKDPA